MDALNFTLILDNDLSNELRHLDPHKSAFELNTPNSLSGNVSMPKTAIATMSNWIHDENDKIYNPTDFMLSIGTT